MRMSNFTSNISDNDSKSSNESGEKSPRRLIAEFNPAPSQAIQKKFDYFYKPYAPQ